MGGEPTFVSMDDPDGDGVEHRGPRAEQTPARRRSFHRLRKRYGAQGLVHFGQGKWYPGEQLPRWSLNCFWRTDGEPIWRDRMLIADETQAGDATRRRRERVSRGVAERLGLDPSICLPALRRLFYYLWRERRLPANVDPFDSRLEDPLERERSCACVHPRLRQVVGYALPVARDCGTRTMAQRTLVFARASVAIWFPAIRRWATGCRSIRSPGSAQATTQLSTRRIQRSQLPPLRKLRANSAFSRPGTTP